MNWPTSGFVLAQVVCALCDLDKSSQHWALVGPLGQFCLMSAMLEGFFFFFFPLRSQRWCNSLMKCLDFSLGSLLAYEFPAWKMASFDDMGILLLGLSSLWQFRMIKMSGEHLEGKQCLMSHCCPILEWTSVSPGARSLSLSQTLYHLWKCCQVRIQPCRRCGEMN